MNEEKLREILKRGDPAAGEPGMTQEEVREMRRVVLSAVPEPRKRGWLAPVLAGGAALVLVALIVLWPSPPEELAVRPPLPRAGEGRGEGPAVVTEKKTPPRPSPAPQEREPPPAPPEKEKVVEPEPEPVVLAQADGPTQIQFSTPGGTRVIWVLQPATE